MHCDRFRPAGNHLESVENPLLKSVALGSVTAIPNPGQ
jgi:hypothetical protein